MAKASTKNSDYYEKEAQERFEAALRAGLKTPPKPQGKAQEENKLSPMQKSTK
jgi:hypothetical protein